MKARTLIAPVVAALALAAPVAAAAKVIPAKGSTHAKPVVKHTVAPRVLCICITLPVGPVSVESEAQFEADVDADMVAHGLDPIYGTTATAATTTADTSTTAG